MEADDYSDVISVEEIAKEFKIPFLSELIKRGKKVSVNMDHISGWFEEDGHRHYFAPNVEFHPLDEGQGFHLVHIHAELKNGQEIASVYSFASTNEELMYQVTLSADGHIAEKIVVLTEDDFDEELETYPPYDSVEGLFKELDYNPTRE